LMQISEKQVEAHISNLRGRLNYETKKATKLGFSTLQDYIKDKLIKEIEKQEQPLQVIPKIKRTKTKPIKKIAAPTSSCSCCP
jgi:hypothetical protein